MASTHCAFCERYVHMSTIWAEWMNIAVEFGPDGEPIHFENQIQGIATCDHCGRASMGVTNYQTSSNDAKGVFDYADEDTFTWYPASGSSPEFADVPTHIAAAAKEAHGSASINNPMAAILMARTVVEASAKAKGITSGRLVEKIDAMHAAGLIRTDTMEAAHEIRHFGNDMAHGDIEDRPSSADAAEVLSLMDEVLSEVFQGPARTARIRARRTGA